MTGPRPWTPPDGRTRLVPSLLAADFARLGEAARLMERAGADWLQVDVMDGHFVPNLSFGPDAVRGLRPETKLALDVHLMVEGPGLFLNPFAAAGADLCTAHVEACPEPRPILRAVRALGLKAGLALRPSTPLPKALPFLGEMDLLLVMTVEPGFGGQEFLEPMLEKIRQARQAIAASGRPVYLQVDGGINLRTAPLAVEAGADSLVAGSAIFHDGDPARALRELRAACDQARAKARI